MEPLLTRILAGDVLLADGAAGTMLFERGLGPGDCPESVNLDAPEVLVEIARLYREAGADIVQANTFGGSPLKLSSYGLAGRADEINRNAVEAVRRGAGPDAYVCGSCGPSGRTLEPYGDTSPQEIRQSFATQIGTLLRADVDVICVETMIDLREAAITVAVAKELAPQIPLMASMTFHHTPRGYFTVMGTDVAAAIAGLQKAGADIVGSNCGNGTAAMVEIAREFRSRTDLPILIQPNAGLPEVQGDRAVHPETPEFMATRAKELVTLGVSILGGCCGTTPAHTRALREMLDTLRRDQAPSRGSAASRPSREPPSTP